MTDTTHEPPTINLKQEIATQMIDFVQNVYRHGCGKVATITVQIDFKDGQMIGFERKAK